MQEFDKKLWNDNIGFESSNYLRINVDEHTTLVVKDQNNVAVKDGDLLIEGTVLTITATPESTYKIKTLTVNGNAFESGETITVYAGISIVAKSTNLYFVNLTADENTTVTVMDGETPVASGGEVEYGSTITVITEYATGYEKNVLTANNIAISSGDTVTVLEDIEIVASAKAIDYTVSVSEDSNTTVTITKGGVAFNPLTDKAHYGDKLVISTEYVMDYEKDALTVNSEAINSGDEITISGNVIIVATAKKVDYTITVTDDVNTTVIITKDGNLFNPLTDKAHYGNKVIVTAVYANGYEKNVLTQNDVAINSGDVVTVFGNIEVVASAKAIDYTITVTADDYATVTLTKDSETFDPLTDKAHVGDQIVVSVDFESGYEKDTLTSNGVNIKNGDTITVAGNVSIIVTSKLASVSLTAITTEGSYSGLEFDKSKTPDFSYLIDGSYNIGEVVLAMFGDVENKLFQLTPLFAELENEEKAFALVYMEQDLSGDDPVMNGQVIYTNYLGDEFDDILGDFNGTMPDTVGWHLTGNTIGFGETLDCATIHETAIYWNGIWVGGIVASD